MSESPELSKVLASASRIVSRVISGQSLSAQAAAFGSRGPMRGALTDIVYGTLRRYGRGDAILIKLARRSLDSQVRALLLCALYAIESAKYADHVAVDQAVRACEGLRKQAAKPFVNAILRAFLRDRNVIDLSLADNVVARTMHPPWWVAKVGTAYPEDWEAVLSAGNQHPPMALRVNRRKTDPASYIARLERSGIRAASAGGEAVLLERPVGVDELPGFSEGEVSVQDLGAQRAALSLDLADGQHVLDACAAPGGKASHMLEIADVELLALDADPERCKRIGENFARLRLEGAIQAADCSQPESWWDGRPFDRILADVPCTASGIARRRPDIKWLRRSGDAAHFAATQLRILGALWRVLAPGGKLLYVTCSVFPEENSAVVDAFCGLQPAARQLGLPGNAKAQLLPGPENDGFYFALLQK